MKKIKSNHNIIPSWIHGIYKKKTYRKLTSLLGVNKHEHVHLITDGHIRLLINIKIIYQAIVCLFHLPPPIHKTYNHLNTVR